MFSQIVFVSSNEEELKSADPVVKSPVNASVKMNLGDEKLHPVNNGSTKPFKIFVGYDPREDLAFEVCRSSILKRSSIPVEVIPIKQSDLRSNGIYWRERGKFESTEFSFSRFLSPYLANFEGWAMFVDCDFLYLTDIKELTELIDDKYAIMCVQHDYTPKETTKMDGVVQTVYPRKNWSSMVLYNCGHPKNHILTPDVVNSQSGAFLHRFQWLDDHEIGSIPFVWNFLVGHNKVDEKDPTTFPKAIHYTTGGPWFESWKNCDFADLWLNEMEEYKKEMKLGRTRLFLHLTAGNGSFLEEILRLFSSLVFLFLDFLNVCALHVHGNCSIGVEGFKPTHFTLASVLSACSSFSTNIEHGSRCRSLSIKVGLHGNIYVENALMGMHMSSLGNKRVDLFDMGAGGSEPRAEDNIQVAACGFCFLSFICAL
ncbi:hypothetical protein HHK36_012153 [Tetracentron sinense]|uniref:Uncharacterized protein n=1 Tax=Tetracentron sinense TaxID=13715 RepID=A0A835DIE4_TETSI|nr:hypothetical protein HHK36_012153 [Tetracentron sinense]